MVSFMVNGRFDDRKYQTWHRKMNPEKYIAYNRKYKENNRQKIRKENKEYYDQNRDEILRKFKEKRKAHPIITKRKQKAYREKNRNRIRLHSRNFYQSHIDDEKERHKKLYRTGGYREYQLKWKKELTKERKKGNLCVQCGQKNDMLPKFHCSSCCEKNNLKHIVNKFIALQKISHKKIPECLICGEKNILLLTKHHKESIPKEQLEKERSHYINGRIANGSRKTDDLEVRCHNCNMLAEFNEKGRCFSDKKLLENELRKRGIIDEDMKIE